MKIVKLIIISIVAIIAIGFIVSQNAEASPCEGRCTGSSSCSACKNCSRCAHCNSGGTCGVCSSRNSYSSYSSNSSNSNSSSSTKSKNNSSSKSNSSPKKVVTKTKSTVKTYYVKTTLLNIRKEPSKTSEIICVIKKKGKIKILKSYDEYWYSVEVFQNGKKIKGFVTKGSIL